PSARPICTPTAPGVTVALRAPSRRRPGFDVEFHALSRRRPAVVPKIEISRLLSGMLSSLEFLSGRRRNSQAGVSLISNSFRENAWRRAIFRDVGWGNMSQRMDDSPARDSRPGHRAAARD